MNYTRHVVQQLLYARSEEVVGLLHIILCLWFKMFNVSISIQYVGRRLCGRCII